MSKPRLVRARAKAFEDLDPKWLCCDGAVKAMTGEAGVVEFVVDLNSVSSGLALCKFCRAETKGLRVAVINHTRYTHTWIPLLDIAEDEVVDSVHDIDDSSTARNL